MIKVFMRMIATTDLSFIFFAEMIHNNYFGVIVKKFCNFFKQKRFSVIIEYFK